ncbi:unnamed protein product [Dicrocoelium dendriticum]|nr:unnamed protein product [Dicrocoelium dendriticum]
MERPTRHPTTSICAQLALNNAHYLSDIKSQVSPVTSLVQLITTYFLQLVTRFSGNMERNNIVNPNFYGDTTLTSNTGKTSGQVEDKNSWIPYCSHDFSVQQLTRFGHWTETPEKIAANQREHGSSEMTISLSTLPTYNDSHQNPWMGNSALVDIEESENWKNADPYAHLLPTGVKSGLQKDCHSLFWCNHPGCSRMFCSRTSLLRHRMIHDPKLPFPCEYPQCTRQFHYRSELARHQLTHSRKSHSSLRNTSPFSDVTSKTVLEGFTKGQYVCDRQGCGKRFSTSVVLSRHRQTHQSRKERTAFVCSYPDCNRTFLRQYNMEEHMNTHTGARPHKCRFPGCNKRFRQRSALCHHKTVHRERPRQLRPPKSYERKSCTRDAARHQVNMQLRSTLHVI